MKKTLGLIGSMLLLCACQTLPTSGEWLLRGDGYFHDGKPQKALTCYNKAIALNSSDAKIYSSRGAVYFYLGEYESAAADFVKALEIGPQRAEVFAALASALAAQGNYQDAMQAVNASVILQPGRAETFFTRGGINLMLGQYEQAVHDYTMVLNTRPAADVYRARANAYLKLGQTQAAEQDMQTAQEFTPAKLSDYGGK